jgi:glycosyltransferase involved in cell wall biosynthesis
MQVRADQYTIKLINTDVRSCGLARNIGLDHATGEYIWFIDGDYWIVNNQAIWTILTTMKTQDEKIIRFDYEAPSFKFYGFPSMVW